MPGPRCRSTWSSRWPTACSSRSCCSVFSRTDGPLYLLPIAGAAADVFENISIALLASTYDGAPSSWTRVAATFTLLKSGLILATLAAAVGGVVRWLWVARRTV